jgi:acyl transferase domain-containing protein/acyl carrier protein
LLEQVLNTPNLDLATKLRHLRVVYLNGEVVTRTLRNRFRELFPHVTLLNDYSISECHDVCTYDLAELNPAISPKYAPLGLPMTNVRVYLLDDALQPVPMGFRGEIFVGGDSVARGYLNEPERTAERFILDPIRNDGSRLFRTGDAGRILPNGHLEIQGRIAFMVKLRGYSIVPGAVETTIAAHPAVNVAVVTTLDNEETGQPEHLVAYVVGNGQVDDEILVEQLRPYLKDQLPHYAVPSYLIPLATLPLTAIGKLDRSQLPKPDLAALRSRSSALVAPPETKLEKAISAVWQGLFHTDLVDTTDNFFDLGGHSLLAAELCTRLRDTLDLQVSVVDIFHYPTIRTLAQALHAQVEAAPVRLDVHVPTRPFADTDIAIIGLACRFPGAEDAEQFWSNLREGVCSIRQFSDEELAAQGVPPAVYTQPDYVKAGAVIDGVDQFDPTFWGISRREAIFMDPQHRLFLECCWQALEHAGYAPTQHGARTGVFAGTFLPSYLLHVLHGGGLMDAANPALAHLTEIGNDKDYIATRVSHLLNLRGPSVTVQTSCSTGLVTIATACQSLMAGQCDTALAGASSLTFPQAGYQYVDGFVSSRDGQCRAFDADASGTILGDGVGVVVLKRLEDAKAAGDHIMAVIKGFAVNNDGNLKADYSAPSVQGQAEVVAMAQAMAGIDPETITYIEAHGTGTLIGDPIEVRALTTAFQQATTHTGFCGLGSVKPNIGHSNIAAGVAGLIKIVLCLQHRQLPPTINFSTLNPAMELEGTPFYVNDRLREWEVPNGVPRRAGVTSLGIGGTNCHMVLEEWLEPAATVQAPSVSTPMSHLLTVSAKTPAALEQNTRNLIEHLQAHPDLNLADVAYTLHVGREAFPHRLAVACDDAPTAIAQLTQAVKRSSGKLVAPGTRSVVLMFSGQGAQYLGMGKGLYETIPAFRQHVETCSVYLKPLIEADLCEMLYRVDEHPEVLNRADFLQPALFTVEYAMARTLIDWGLQPKAVVGHSLGEYAAACIAGVVSLEDALGLVVTRGKAMEAAGAGAMLAVSQSEDDIRAFLASREPQVFTDGPDASLAAINAPGRVVLSGSCQAIARIETELQEADIACQRVHVARAFHSPMMQSAAEAITRKAETVTLHLPVIPLASNLSGTWLTDEQAQDPAYWSEHMLQPVRFADNVRTLLQQQPDVLLEVGPGRILSGLAGDILRQASELTAPLISPSMRHPRQHTTTDAHFLLQTLSRLWVAGVDLDWQAFHAGASRQRVPLPSYAFDRQRCWPENGMVQPRLQPSLVPSTHGHLADGKLALADRFYLPSWQRTLPPASEPLHDSARWLVFLDSTGTAGALGAELVAALEQQGHEVTRVYRDSDAAVPGATDRRTVVVNPDRAEDYAALLQQLEQADMAPQRLLYLWALDHATLAVGPALRQAYDHLLHLAQALAAHAIQDSCDLWIVTDQTVQVDREAVQPVKATLLGPSTVLPQENPQVGCRVVDVQLPDEPGDVAGLVEHLLHECTAATPDVEPVLALRGEHRWIPRYEAFTLETSANGAGKRWLQSHKTYVMTGGLGRIGLELCQYLSQLPSNLVLTTRKAFPDRAQWEGLAASPDVDPALQSTLKQLLQCEAVGATVCVVQADMADADDVQRLCAETIDRFGMISGIFHAAGVADLHYLPDLSPEICAQEFAPKLYGVLHLERAIEQLSHKPEFVVLFSSMAAVLGGVAMTAYTAANRFMDAFVQAHPRRHGVAWLSINWDDWDFTYTKEQIAAYEKTQAAQYAMPPADGIAALERILAYGRPMQLLVTTRPLEARITQWLHQHTAVAGAAHLDVDAVAPMDIDDASALEQRIARVYQEVLGLPSVAAEANFFDLGGDSLLASQILLQLRRQLPQAVSLQLHAIFDCPTVRDMAKHVAGAEVEA